MHIDARQGTLLVKLGPSFVIEDARRLGEIVQTLVPLSNLVLDFTAVRECHDAAFFTLSDVLRGSHGAHLRLRGVTLHQARLLRYLGRGRDSQLPSP